MTQVMPLISDTSTLDYVCKALQKINLVVDSMDQRGENQGFETLYDFALIYFTYLIGK